MHYFDYQTNKPMSGVWELFADLANVEDSKIQCAMERGSYSHTLEIVQAALNGSLVASSESEFDLAAYEYKCSENDKNAKFSRCKRILNIVEERDSEEESVGYGDISERHIPSVDNVLDALFEDEDFNANLRRLYNIRKTYVVELGLDPVSVLYNALKGVPEAVKEMGDLMLENIEMKNIFTALCEGSTDGKLMKELAMAV